MMSLRHASFLAAMCLLVSRSDVRADFLDEAQRSLSITTFDHNLQLQLSGTLDLENYYVAEPAPGLIYTDKHYLFNPRLTVYLDAQLGSQLFSFVQVRFDRGFDPSDDGPRVRLDEYALRITPWKEIRFALQAGKFGTIVGNWVPRHYSWENPFINAPLPYENLTGIWDSEAPRSTDELLHWGHVPYDGNTQFGDGYSDKYRRLPVIWGPSYASGLSLSLAVQRFDLAIEVKNAALASRPESWDLTQRGFDNPTVSGRFGYSPTPAWSFGLSGSAGPYLSSEAASTLRPGQSLGDYREILIGQDISYAWRHLQLWAEVFQSRFQVPNVGDADILSYYIEAKYKLTAQLFVALRWNQQLYGTVPDGQRQVQWGNNAARIDSAIGYRFSTYLELKLQYSFTHFNNDVREGEQLFASQLTLKF